jgi:hypothetical protein
LLIPLYLSPLAWHFESRGIRSLQLQKWYLVQQPCLRSCFLLNHFPPDDRTFPHTGTETPPCPPPSLLSTQVHFLSTESGTKFMYVHEIEVAMSYAVRVIFT